jgi:hypothetical protein
MASSLIQSLSSLTFLIAYAAAQTSCSSAISAKYPAPSVAAGYHANLIANGFTSPRQILFDSAGNLLVVESGKGITGLTLNDAGGSCLSVKSKATVVSDSTVRARIPRLYNFTAYPYNELSKILSAQSCNSIIYRWKDTLCF